MANPNWVKGMKSPNPQGRRKENREFLDELKAEGSEDAKKALMEKSKEGEPWAVSLVLAYCWGKPSEAQFDITSVSDDELAAEIFRRGSGREMEPGVENGVQNAEAADPH